MQGSENGRVVTIVWKQDNIVNIVFFSSLLMGLMELNLHLMEMEQKISRRLTSKTYKFIYMSLYNLFYTGVKCFKKNIKLIDRTMYEDLT